VLSNSSLAVTVKVVGHSRMEARQRKEHSPVVVARLTQQVLNLFRSEMNPAAATC
jgi:hypothetical protein